MKSSIKFSTIIIAVLLASTLLLTGCMYAIAASNGEAKPYNFDAMSNTNIGVNVGDAPVSQTDLKKKFSAMSSIDKENNSITVITQEYLNEYWQSNYEKEVIHSLSTEEVLYIIQDSIDLYFNKGYSEIYFPDFASVSSKLEIAERFPLGTEVTYKTSGNTPKDDMEIVYDIIVRRITLLSSPKAFFKGGNETRYYYVPGFTEDIDREYREYLADHFEGKMSSVIDEKIISGWFQFAEIGGGWEGTIIYQPEESKFEQVYPTKEFASRYEPTLVTEYGDEGCYFHLNLITGTFNMSGSSYQSFAITGSFERKDDDLYLCPKNSSEDVYVLHREGDHFVSKSKEAGMGLKEGLIFRADNDAFWDILLDWTPPEKEPNQGGTVTTQPDDTFPMESGIYEFPKDMREKMYDVLVLPENEWTEAIPDCDWQWEWKAESYDGQIVELRLCDCKTITDFTNQRSRKLTDDEWEWICDMFVDYST